MMTQRLNKILIFLKNKFSIKQKLTQAYDYGYFRGVCDTLIFYDKILTSLQKRVIDIEKISDYNSMEVDRLRNKLKELNILDSDNKEYQRSIQ